ncbi:response regulator [Agrobacterium pusense]|uniref:response regulator n=1 Tax=Agrobacterium pusense TaxID=648995 RepID=UPI00156AE1CA|nr:response regulator transcription factor [Agrobacterium pusense]MBM7327552.1 response regulator transcription factor [Agrobacterium sp. S2]MBW9069375.1 response regulator transcription factor [Agrobacterium pusense]MBW9078752.1 response regulator transcription factor [Agrobacterium pusense]MBW9083675.1 response regulator transcription factor [Agrobacterium pusense]MBW9123995.1 response regulator transcription factor [Agrobacterium pusense]
MTENIKVVIVDDHPMFRSGVSQSLKECGFDVLGEGENADEALALATRLAPDIILLDISMPGNGLAAIKSILSLSPSIRILILTASESVDDLQTAIQSGAAGYALKGVGSRELVQMLRTIADGGRYIPPELGAKLLAERKAASELMEQRQDLSRRERQVMDLIAIGMSNKLVARKLGLHEKTVKHHVTRIFAKLKVSNRTEAALLWRDRISAQREP